MKYLNVFQPNLRIRWQVLWSVLARYVQSIEVNTLLKISSENDNALKKILTTKIVLEKSKLFNNFQRNFWDGTCKLVFFHSTLIFLTFLLKKFCWAPPRDVQKKCILRRVHPNWVWSIMVQHDTENAFVSFALWGRIQKNIRSSG